MISLASGKVLSNLGWADQGAIWVYEPTRRTNERISISPAGCLNLSRHRDGRSVLIDYTWEDRRFVEVHRADSLGIARLRVTIAGDHVDVEGDLAEMEGQRQAFVYDFLAHVGTGRQGLRLVEVRPTGVRVRPLDWFVEGGYDGGYQSVIAVLEMPDGAFLFGVQRSSQLILCDPGDLSVIRRISLAGRSGNPVPFLRAGGSQLCAIDYDTLVLVDPISFEVRDRWLGQAAPAGTQMFLGDVWSQNEHSDLLVARPGSGDVVQLDATSLLVKRRWDTGRQPLEAALVDGGVIARDWKSGDLLVGAPR